MTANTLEGLASNLISVPGIAPDKMPHTYRGCKRVFYNMKLWWLYEKLTGEDFDSLIFNFHLMNYWESVLICNCSWMLVVIWFEADDNSAVSFV